MGSRFGFIAAAVFVGAACGGSSNDPSVAPSQAGTIDLDAGPPKTATDGPTGLPCEVDRILSANCRKCHSSPPQYGAPMPLLDYADLHAEAPSGGKKVFEMAAFKIGNDASPMPPSPNARLSEADRKIITDWALAGAPRHDGPCTTTPPVVGPPDPVSGLKCTPNKTLAPAAAYELSADAGDQYVCWGVDVTADTPTHIVGFAPRIDNTKITHHVVMYESSSSYPTTPQPCSSGASFGWRMVLAWAPGVGGIDLPPEAGFPVTKAGTHYVVQMHYSNPQKLKGEKDSSKIEVCTAPPRQFEADVMAFGSQNFTIPAAPPPDGTFSIDCSLKIPTQFKGLHLFTVMPHMHKIGVGMKSTITRQAGGPEIDIGTMPNFDFNAQTWLPVNAVTEDGDTVKTTCDWKNTTGSEVKFGEKTADEMCYSFTMYYPRISSPIWSWATPALTSTCTPRN